MPLFTIQQRFKYYFSCCIFLYMCVFFLVRIYPSALLSECAFFLMLLCTYALFSCALFFYVCFFPVRFFPVTVTNTHAFAYRIHMNEYGMSKLFSFANNLIMQRLYVFFFLVNSLKKSSVLQHLKTTAEKTKFGCEVRLICFVLLVEIICDHNNELFLDIFLTFYTSKNHRTF